MAGKTWTPTEDIRLAALIGELQPHDAEGWERVAAAFGGARSANACRWRWARGRPKAVAWTPQHDKLLKLLQGRPYPLSELVAKLDEKPSSICAMLEDLRRRGVIVSEQETSGLVAIPSAPPTPMAVPALFARPANEWTLGIISDTHIGSNAEQPSALLAVIRYMYEHGARAVLHAGDLGHGHKVYTGQASESYASLWEAQIQAVVDRLPRFPDLRYWILGGNHDWSWFRDFGADFMGAVAQRRNDVIPVGYDSATVPLSLDPPVDAHLWHGKGARPYALSYPVQRYAERGLLPYEEIAKAIAGVKTGPTIRMLIVGHFHRKLGGMGIGPLECWLGGCFEGRNSFSRRLGLWPDVGGWLVRLRLDKEGRLITFVQEWIPAPTIENDYLNWPVSPASWDERREPIFVVESHE